MIKKDEQKNDVEKRSQMHAMPNNRKKSTGDKQKK
jgi:hypothetical protein